MAEGTFLPLVALLQNGEAPKRLGAPWYGTSCAGAISPMYTAIGVRAEVRIAA